MMHRAFWDKRKLRDYQNKRLRHIVKYAYENSHFYHEKYSQIGIRPEDIRTIEDLNKLPIVRKDDLARNPADVVSLEYDISKLSIQRTSGSTGRPLHIYLAGAENEFRKAKHVRAQMVLGQKPWHKWVTITSPLHFAETSKLQKVLRLYSVSPISVFDDIDTQISKIEALKPDVLDGYSNSILLLAREMKNRGQRTIRPRFLVSGAELIDGGSRKFVEEVFGVPFYDQYACVELERMAWQCREKDEYHVDADSLVMEFVDTDGEAVAPGEQGEVVCTSLFNRAMPFVRYALDDIGVPSDKGDCTCGRGFPLMKVLEGRKTSILNLPNGRVLAPFAFMLAVWSFGGYGSVEAFRVVQRRKDLLVFKVKLKKGVTNGVVLARELVEHVRKTLRLPVGDVDVEVEFVDDIPLDKSGKFRIVVSEIAQNG